MYAPELETLEQLLGGDMPLTVIANLYSTPEAFWQGIRGLLSCGDVLLLDDDGNAVLSGDGGRFSRRVLTPNSVVVFGCE